MTIREWYRWAEDTGNLDRDIVTFHTKEFDDDIGAMDWQRINGETFYIEWADEATAAKYKRWEHGEEEVTDDDSAGIV